MKTIAVAVAGTVEMVSIGYDVYKKTSEYIADFIDAAKSIFNALRGIF